MKLPQEARRLAAFPRRQRGAIVVLIAVAMLAILAMGGLALDGSHLFLNKSRLQNTVDAAALGAAKILDQTGDVDLARNAALGLMGLNSNALGNRELRQSYSGGMNVTVRALAGELARAGISSDLYTRATSPDDPPVVEVEPGVRVLHLPAGPLAPIPKQHLPRYLCAFLCSLLRAGERHGPYDVLHSHYWVSGWVARLARERWDSPVVHSFHTLGRVKNRSLAAGDRPEPPARLAGEERVAAAADRLLAPTPAEARQLVELYGAAPGKVRIVPPCGRCVGP